MITQPMHYNTAGMSKTEREAAMDYIEQTHARYEDKWCLQFTYERGRIVRLDRILDNHGLTLTTWLDLLWMSEL